MFGDNTQGHSIELTINRPLGGRLAYGSLEAFSSGDMHRKSIRVAAERSSSLCCALVESVGPRFWRIGMDGQRYKGRKRRQDHTEGK